MRNSGILLMPILAGFIFVGASCDDKTKNCSKDSDCDAAAYCDRGVCTSEKCANQSECFSGRKCFQGICVTSACEHNNGGCDATNGTCTETSDGRACSCKEGLSVVNETGCADICQVENGKCDSRTTICKHEVASSKVTCDCKAGFKPITGNQTDCECDPTACLPDKASCKDTGTGTACKCNDGYTGDGITSCTLLAGACAVNPYPCDKNASCTSVNDVAQCTCVTDFAGDGKRCCERNMATNQSKWSVIPAPIPDSDYVVADNEVIDLKTCLIWKQYSEVAGVDGYIGLYPWDQANKLCIKDGDKNWRLPTKSELESIVDHSSGSPGLTINKHGFPNAQPEHYWTSSTPGNVAGSAWCVSFGSGRTDSCGLVMGSGYVRCVR